MKKKGFFIAIIMVVLSLSALNAQKTTWKVLWVVAPNINAPKPAANGGGICNNTMTDEQKEWCKVKVPKAFKDFIEDHSNGKLNIQITVDVLTNTVTEFDVSTDIKGIKIPDADKLRLNIEENYDCLMIMANYSGCNLTWAGVNYNYGNLLWVSQVPMYYDVNNMQYQNNVAIHEWIHQIEAYFPSINPAFATPVLHSDEADYKYTPANTGLSGENRLEKWYADYIKGAIVIYPGVTSIPRGIDADWWQYNPLKFRDFKEENADRQLLQYKPFFSTPNNLEAEFYGGDNVTGALNIPETVTHNGFTYTVTKIAEAAFFNDVPAITSISIPATVTAIGDNAFRNMFIDLWNNQGFQRGVVIMNSSQVPSLGNDAFSIAKQAGKLTVPCDAVNAYKAATNWSAFDDRIQGPGTADFTALNTEGQSLKYRADGCSLEAELYGGDNVTGALNIPETVTHNGFTYTVTKIAEAAFFNDVPAITSISIPATVTAIGDNAFRNMFIDLWNNQGFQRGVVIMNSSQVPSLGNDAFSIAKQAGKLTVPCDAVNAYKAATNWSAFDDRIQGPGTADFTALNTEGQSLKYRADGCSLEAEFYGGDNVTGALNIPETVTHNGFTYTVTKIAEYTFFDDKAPSITSIKIPATVKAIGLQAFNNLFWDTEGTITMTGSQVPSLGNDAFWAAKRNRRLIVPCDAVNAYKAATNWSAFGDRIVCNGTGVPANANEYSPQPKAYYNILGKQLEKEPEKGIYIILYENGKTEKIIK